MKKTIFVPLIALIIFNAAFLSFKAERGDGITIGEVKQVNSVKTVNTINERATKNELSFIAVALTRTVTVGEKNYEYILWTEDSITSEQAKKIIERVAASTNGKLAKISEKNTSIISGNPYEWQAGGGRNKYLVFSRYALRPGDKSVLSSFAYGVYTEAAEPAATTLPTTTAQPQTSTTLPLFTVITQTTAPENGATRPQTTQTTSSENSTTAPSDISTTQTEVSSETTEGPMFTIVTQTTAPENGATRPQTTQMTSSVISETTAASETITENNYTEAIPQLGG